ncbi:hypothetical protein CYMTET_47712 [Cymbomonas tetramitiformis]|uniref:Uncharacterized protein n=1 Tax=Cymbomonas tetramitiformis TaxID=36881 RepID=A0AAE0BUP9_9CHLO|nr:hypothetical protein CYMTET_47712 [Cymbomonas tetramitiformis]
MDERASQNTRALSAGDVWWNCLSFENTDGHPQRECVPSTSGVYYYKSECEKICDGDEWVEEANVSMAQEIARQLVEVQAESSRKSHNLTVTDTDRKVLNWNVQTDVAGFYRFRLLRPEYPDTEVEFVIYINLPLKEYKENGMKSKKKVLDDIRVKAEIDLLYVDTEISGHVIISFVRLMTAGFAQLLLRSFNRYAHEHEAIFKTHSFALITIELEDASTFRQNVHLLDRSQRTWCILADKPTYYERQRFYYKLDDERSLIEKERHETVLNYVKRHFKGENTECTREAGIMQSESGDLVIDEAAKPYFDMTLADLATEGLKCISDMPNMRPDAARHFEQLNVLAYVLEQLKGPLNSRDIVTRGYHEMRWEHKYCFADKIFNGYKLWDFELNNNFSINTSRPSSRRKNSSSQSAFGESRSSFESTVLK